MKDEREILFEAWRPWRTMRKPVVTPDCGGVYLIAHCKTGRPPQIPTPNKLPFQIVYIGEAKDLNDRPLSGNHRKIKDKYARLFGPTQDALFVAFAKLYETGCDDYNLQRLFSTYLEALLVLRYAERHGYPPVLHYKERDKHGPPPSWVIPVLKKLK